MNTMEQDHQLLLSQYLNKVQSALMNFQFIEEGLKFYLEIAYLIISIKLNSLIPFEFTYKDLQNDSLGRLLVKFKKLNSNKALITEIEQLQGSRNYYAHQAYTLTVQQQNDITHLNKELDKIEEVMSKSKKCFDELKTEVTKIDEIRKSLK